MAGGDISTLYKEPCAQLNGPSMSTDSFLSSPDQFDGTRHYLCFLRWPKWFIFLLRYEFSIPNSEFRILNSEFRISKKMLCIEILFLEIPHQGPCTGWGLLI